MKTKEDIKDAAWANAENDLGGICFMEGGLNNESAYDASYSAFIAGAEWQKEQSQWREFTEDVILQEQLYLCKWESSDPDYTEIKILSWSDGYWINIEGDYDENVTHFKYID